MEDPVVVQPTRKLRICRNPACETAFDPAWRVRQETDPPDAENRCPRCGVELDRNPISGKRKDDEFG